MSVISFPNKGRTAVLKSYVAADRATSVYLYYLVVRGDAEAASEALRYLITAQTIKGYPGVLATEAEAEFWNPADVHTLCKSGTDVRELARLSLLQLTEQT